LTNPPYGYKVDPNNRKKWIADEEAATVVKRIFDLCVAGNGPMRIAEVLRKIVHNRIFAVTAMFYVDITAFMELIQEQRFDEVEKT
jgi:hypothetical protein